MTSQTSRLRVRPRAGVGTGATVTGAVDERCVSGTVTGSAGTVGAGETGELEGAAMPNHTPTSEATRSSQAFWRLVRRRCLTVAAWSVRLVGMVLLGADGFSREREGVGLVTTPGHRRRVRLKGPSLRVGDASGRSATSYA